MNDIVNLFYYLGTTFIFINGLLCILEHDLFEKKIRASFILGLIVGVVLFITGVILDFITFLGGWMK